MKKAIGIGMLIALLVALICVVIFVIPVTTLLILIVFGSLIFGFFALALYLID